MSSISVPSLFVILLSNIFILAQYPQYPNDFSLQCLVKCCTKIQLYYKYRVLFRYLVCFIKSSENKEMGLVNSSFSLVYQPTPAIIPASLIVRTCLFFFPSSYFSNWISVFTFLHPVQCMFFWFSSKWKEMQLSERAGEAQAATGKFSFFSHSKLVPLQKFSLLKHVSMPSPEEYSGAVMFTGAAVMAVWDQVPNCRTLMQTACNIMDT